MKLPSKFLIATLCFFFTLHNTKASHVDTVRTFSASMNKYIKAVVVTPDGYNGSKELPVVYLLHGFGDNYSGWIRKAKNFEKAADLHNIIIVCPDGNTSWYWDSPIDEKYKYETYVSSELVKWVDSAYTTIKSKKGRGITGLSMGGHGALFLAFKHQDVFGAAGSMSGGVDIRPFPNNWEMAQRLGSYAENAERWEKNTVVNLLHLLTPNRLALMIDCGTEDFFYDVNENLHKQLLYRNIPHDYLTRPGAHNWDYWTNAIKFQLLFMDNFFKAGAKK
jgi:S-formylglutathione hydrolase FrmB